MDKRNETFGYHWREPAELHGNAGERSAHHILTEPHVVEIMRRWKAGESQRALAREYGVQPTTVSNIIRGRTWAHVQWPKNESEVA